MCHINNQRVNTRVDESLWAICIILRPQQPHLLDTNRLYLFVE